MTDALEPAWMSGIVYDVQLNIWCIWNTESPHKTKPFGALLLVS